MDGARAMGSIMPLFKKSAGNFVGAWLNLQFNAALIVV
jgi:hypothetical protein